MFFDDVINRACRVVTFVVVTMLLLAGGTLSVAGCRNHAVGSYLVYDSGMPVAERNDASDWRAVPGKDQDGNETHGYACWDEDDRCWRYIWGGHEPLTWDETTEFSRKNVKVFKAFRNRRTGVYIVLLNPSSDRDALFGPFWRTWTPTVWESVKKAQNL